MQKNPGGGGPALQPSLCNGQRVGKIVFDLDAVARQCNGGGGKLGKGEFARSIGAKGKRESRNGSGHPHGKAAVARPCGHGLARLIEENITRRIGWGGFAVVNDGGFLLLGEMNEHETAAAEISRTRQGDRKGK